MRARFLTGWMWSWLFRLNWSSFSFRWVQMKVWQACQWAYECSRHLGWKLMKPLNCKSQCQTGPLGTLVEAGSCAASQLICWWIDWKYIAPVGEGCPQFKLLHHPHLSCQGWCLDWSQCGGRGVMMFWSALPSKSGWMTGWLVLLFDQQP
jgi:hypothetical protein